MRTLAHCLLLALSMSSMAGAFGAQPQAEAKVQQRINEIRQAHGLGVLQRNPKLDRIARDYSHAMAKREFFSHTGPEGDHVGDRVRAAGLCYRAVGENLAKNLNVPNPAQTAVSGWMKSKHHRANILTAEFRQTGIGAWCDGGTCYFTQIFFRAFPPSLPCPARSATVKPSAEG